MPDNVLGTAIRWFIILLGLLYFMAHFYLYQMMVTFDMPLSEMMRNAFILTLAHLPRNLLVLLLCALVGMITFAFGTLIGLVLTLLISEFMRKKRWIRPGDMKLDL